MTNKPGSRVASEEREIPPAWPGFISRDFCEVGRHAAAMCYDS